MRRFILLALCSCAPGTDGLRQACSNTDTVMTAGYQSVVNWYHQDQLRIRSLSKTDKNEAERALETDEARVQKILSVLDKSVSTLRSACDLIPAIDAGKKHDIPSLILSVIQVAADVQKQLVAFGVL